MNNFHNLLQIDRIEWNGMLQFDKESRKLTYSKPEKLTYFKINRNNQPCPICNKTKHYFKDELSWENISKMINLIIIIIIK